MEATLKTLPTSTTTHKRPTNPQTIFVVEARTDTSRPLAPMLESAGYVVRHFGSAETLAEALDTLESPAAVVCDLNLKGMAALDLLRLFIENERWCLVPCIVVSSGANREDVANVHGLPVPPESFLTRPIDAGILEDALCGVLREKRPIALLREVQRARHAHDLRSRREDRELAGRLQELTREIDEATKAADRVEAEIKRVRSILHSTLGPAEREASIREFERLTELLRRERDKLRELSRVKHTAADRHRETALKVWREDTLLDARIRIARDLVRRGSGAEERRA